MYEELVKRLRERATWINFPHHGEECPTEDAMLMMQAADAIEELQRQIDAWVEPERKALIKSLPKWIPVTERLPEKYQYAVCWVNDEENKMGFYGIGSLSRIGDWYVDGDDYSENGNLHVTHWMPLPQAPKEESK